MVWALGGPQYDSLTSVLSENDCSLNNRHIMAFKLFLKEVRCEWLRGEGKDAEEEEERGEGGRGGGGGADGEEEGGG